MNHLLRDQLKGACTPGMHDERRPRMQLHHHVSITNDTSYEVRTKDDHRIPMGKERRQYIKYSVLRVAKFLQNFGGNRSENQGQRRLYCDITRHTLALLVRHSEG
jgi:hypothetical protein